MPRKHANGWMTVFALGLLVLGLLACLYLLIGFPAEAQVNSVEPSATPPPAYSAPAVPSLHRQQYQNSVAAANAALATNQAAVPAPVRDTTPEQVQAQLDAVRAQLLESEQNLRQATRTQGRIRTTSALFWPSLRSSPF